MKYVFKNEVTTMASEQEMSVTGVNSDEDAESVSGSSGNELSERKRKENIRTGLPSSPFGKIVAVDEEVEEEGEGVDSKSFLDFKIILKVFLHICEYYQRKTYKCAVTRNPKNIP